MIEVICVCVFVNLHRLHIFAQLQLILYSKHCKGLRHFTISPYGNIASANRVLVLGTRTIISLLLFFVILCPYAKILGFQHCVSNNYRIFERHLQVIQLFCWNAHVLCFALIKLLCSTLVKVRGDAVSWCGPRNRTTPDRYAVPQDRFY